MSQLNKILKPAKYEFAYSFVRFLILIFLAKNLDQVIVLKSL